MTYESRNLSRKQSARYVVCNRGSAEYRLHNATATVHFFNFTAIG